MLIHHHHLPYSTGHFFSVLRTGLYAVPQNPMNAMVMVMVKLILNATSPECYISLPLTLSSSPLPPYVFPSPLTPVPQNPMNAMVMVMVKLILNATSPECYITSPYPSPFHPHPSPLTSFPHPSPPPPPPPSARLPS